MEFLTDLYLSRIIVMNNGEIVLEGRPRDVFYQYEELLRSRAIPPQIIQITSKLDLNGKFKPLHTSEFLELMNTERCKSV